MCSDEQVNFVIIIAMTYKATMEYCSSEVGDEWDLLAMQWTDDHTTKNMHTVISNYSYSS